MSPWPIVASFGAGLVAVRFTLYIQFIDGNLIFFSFFLLGFISFLWWRDIFRESNLYGEHPFKVIKGFKYGIALFIASEVLLFFSFFWTFFQGGVSPSLDIGSKWPPIGIEFFNPAEIPLLNTVILLSSGVSVTWSHHCLIKRIYLKSCISIIFTILLGILFTYFQLIEYIDAKFTFWDSTYGSIFFLATGFHGAHVIIGSIFLIVSLTQIIIIYVRNNHHVSFEIAAWYWHFVDVVWLFLYISIYWWRYFSFKKNFYFF